MKFRKSSVGEGDLQINLVSLIDVLLILIIFFVVSTTFNRSREIAIELPKASGHEQETTSRYVEVVISAEGDYAVNDRRLVNGERRTLERAILDVSKGDKTIPFMISADAASPYQSVVTVMDLAGKLGFTRMRLPTSEISDEQ
jgi:biopolymer transport protein ExbD